MRRTSLWIALLLALGIIAAARGESPEPPQPPAQHWAFQPLTRHDPPEVKNTDWPRNAIDHFILARLEAESLSPAPDADRRALLRRATFDLTGLPPPPTEIDAFLSDTSPTAFTRVIDRLLASPHFGERWGRHWLDVARYADSIGGGRTRILKNAWRYRDYTIHAFNADKPYDRFLTEQLAGDLLPHNSTQQARRQIIATTFLTLGPKNLDNQNKDQLDMDIADEQMDTFGQAVLGLTIGCARCHDHKFDPISTEDYYALAGIFTSTQSIEHANVSNPLQRTLPLTETQRQARADHEKAVASLQQQLKKAQAQHTALLGPTIDDSDAEIVGQWTPSTYHDGYFGDGYLHDNKTGKGEKSITYTPDLPAAGTYEVRISYPPGSSRSARVPITIQHADGQKTIRFNQQPAPSGDDGFAPLGQFQFEKGDAASVTISNEGTNGHVMADAVRFVRIHPDDSDNDPTELQAEIAAAEAAVQKLRTDLKKLQDDAPPPRPAAMAVRESDQPADCRINLNGTVESLGDEVPRGFLSVLAGENDPAIPQDQSGRLQLARWLTQPDAPASALTARVMVNRIWRHLFGTGLVPSTDNFGTAGEQPSHPHLLDALAADFIQRGWSVKQIIRHIMQSRTYRLSTQHHDAAARNADPENRLLARTNRRRLDAEAIRDAILAVSDQLDRTPGGPAVEGTVESEFNYEFDSARRAVYLPIFRNALPDTLAAFDFADPNIVQGHRNTSTVPTQALFLMNSDFVIDQSRHAAEQLLAIPDLTDTQRIHRAYRRALSRPPTTAEQRLALQYLADSDPDHTNPDYQSLETWAILYQTLFACIDFRYLH